MRSSDSSLPSRERTQKLDLLKGYSGLTNILSPLLLYGLKIAYIPQK